MTNKPEYDMMSRYLLPFQRDFSQLQLRLWSEPNQITDLRHGEDQEKEPLPLLAQLDLRSRTSFLLSLRPREISNGASSARFHLVSSGRRKVPFKGRSTTVRSGELRPLRDAAGGVRDEVGSEGGVGSREWAALGVKVRAVVLEVWCARGGGEVGQLRRGSGGSCGHGERSWVVWNAECEKGGIYDVMYQEGVLLRGTAALRFGTPLCVRPGRRWGC